MEWIDAFWPIMGWSLKHTLRNTGDDKVARSCAKLVEVWQERKLFGSRSLDGWLDSSGADDAVVGAPGGGGGGGAGVAAGGAGGSNSRGGGSGGGSAKVPSSLPTANTPLTLKPSTLNPEPEALTYPVS